MDFLDNVTVFVNDNPFISLILLIVLIKLLTSSKCFENLPILNLFEPFSDYQAYNAEQLKDGYYVIRGSRNQLYCSDYANGILCNADFAGPHETFHVQNLGKSQYALKSMKNGLWVKLTSTGLQAVAPTTDDYCVFQFRYIGNDKRYLEDDRYKGKFLIQSNKTKNYCMDSGHGLVCDQAQANGNDYQMFEFIEDPEWKNIK